MQSVSVRKAIGRGVVTVYGMFLPFVAGIPILTMALVNMLNLPDIISGLGIFVGILCTWIWWSYRVPQWRLWALQHVDNIEELHQSAVQAGIEWPYGHVFERTEIKSHQQLFQESSLQLRYYLQQVQKLVLEKTNINYSLFSLQEIEHSITQLTTGQKIAAFALDSLEQSFYSFANQQIISLTEEPCHIYIVRTFYFINKYRQASRYI